MISKLLKSKKIFVIAFIIIAVFSVYKYTISQVGVPFGGKVLISFPCKCSGSYLLTISPPMGGQFIYYPGTQAYQSYNLGFMSGMWALGLYSPGAVCMVPAGKGCVSFGAPIGFILPTVGSSLIF